MPYMWTLEKEESLRPLLNDIIWDRRQLLYEMIGQKLFSHCKNQIKFQIKRVWYFERTFPRSKVGDEKVKTNILGQTNRDQSCERVF